MLIFASLFKSNINVEQIKIRMSMKKIMMIAAMMVATLSANAQNEVGQWTLMPKIGINISSVTGDTNAGYDKKAKVGLVAGAEFEVGLAEKFGLDFGLLYSMEGCKVKEQLLGGTPTVNMNLDYINIPILAQYYLAKGFAIKGGLQPAFNVRHKAGGDADYTIDGINSFNLSIPVGLSYEFSNFVIDARYNIGVTKIIKDAEQGRNSTFSITLGYKIPLN